MHLKLIYNPAAGRGRARRHVAEATQYLRDGGAQVDVMESRSAEDLTELAALSSVACDRVVICGGDGSLNLAVRKFDLARGTLALIPLGSGDDFARVLGIPRNTRDACALALGSSARAVDVATANGIRYLGVAGLGFDSEVARHANESVKWLRGSAVYLYSIFRVLPRFIPHPVHLTIDGSRRSHRIMFAVVGNSRQYGGGIRIVPEAIVDDGVLDYCIVHETSRWQLLKTLPKAYSGAHVRSPFVETGRASNLHFGSNTPLDVYADGERLTVTPATFALAEQKLRIIAP